MPRLIIGHVTVESVKLWVRGSQDSPVAHLRVFGNGFETNADVALEARHAYTGVAEIGGLESNTSYECEVQFSESVDSPEHARVDFGHARGKFVTAPRPDKPNQEFSFIIGSCNLHSLGLISSPDRAYRELLRKSLAANAKFMIHCGDQIYYDVPFASKRPRVEEYRDKYLDAWRDCRPARKFLTQLPHYMILDDHEIVDGFANDFDPPSSASPCDYLDPAIKAYREFVHIRNPHSFGVQPLYYEFDHGPASFFVMDTRTERFAFGDPTTNRMVSQEQLDELKVWLESNSDRPKFVVTSVPFIGEVRNNHDKWSGPNLKRQKEEIIDFIAMKGIDKLTFLTGDMHSAYHATMTISSDITIHELMASPINQLHKSNFGRYNAKTSHRTTEGIEYVSRINKDEYFCDHSCAMLITLDGPVVRWEVFRTKRDETEITGQFHLTDEG